MMDDETKIVVDTDALVREAMSSKGLVGRHDVAYGLVPTDDDEVAYWVKVDLDCFQDRVLLLTGEELAKAAHRLLSIAIRIGNHVSEIVDCDIDGDPGRTVVTLIGSGVMA